MPGLSMSIQHRARHLYLYLSDQDLIILTITITSIITITTNIWETLLIFPLKIIHCETRTCVHQNVSRLLYHNAMGIDIFFLVVWTLF